MVKPSESTKTLDQLADDTFFLTQRFAAVSRVNDMSSFKLLIRLFKEQCVIEKSENEAGEKAVARPNKNVPSDPLQNPSDPDAGYSGHKGKGYQAQIVENYSEDDKQLSLLTHVEVESADKHDANALLPALENLQQRDMAPQELLADSLYGSDTNCEQGQDQYNTEVVAPVMPGNQKKTSLAEFTVDEKGRITSCPRGVSPEKVKRKKKGTTAPPFLFPAVVIAQISMNARSPKAKKHITIAIKKKISELLPEEGMSSRMPLKGDTASGPESRRRCRNSTGGPRQSTFEFEGSRQ